MGASANVSNYHADVDPAMRNTSHTLMLEMVGFDKDVLDVGCASGYLAEALGKQDCRVSGIEYDTEAAEEARPHLDKLVVGDVTTMDFVAEFGAGVFDVIVFGDVLEHLPDPGAVLRSSLAMLRDGGTVVISIPNVTHGSLRLALLEGRWSYTPTGLLDRTHVRFFTRASLAEMLAEAGLRVEEAKASVADPLRTEVQVDDEALPGGVVQWVREQPDAMVYQFVVRAAVGEPTQPWPRLVPAVELEPVEDEHRRRAHEAMTAEEVAAERDRLLAEVVDLRRRVLTLRDHAVGCSAELGRMRADYHVLERRLAEAAAGEAVATARLDAALQEITNLRASVSWRLGNGFVRPFSRVLRLIKRAAR